MGGGQACDDFVHVIWIHNLEGVIGSHSLYIAAPNVGCLKGVRTIKGFFFKDGRYPYDDGSDL